ncbi:MAG: SulP family inorganic anion transporter [Chitinophagaceae bacterium]
MKKYFQHAGSDIPASIVVFLVALPLCLGIALGSGAPLFSGIIAGVVGGIVIGILSGSQLSVSGPAAGLTAIVVVAIGKLEVYPAFLLSVVIAGALQLVLGFVKAGIVGDYIPNSVIKGMLAAIGLILIMKQIPHLVGFDADFEGDETFGQANANNTFSGITHALAAITPAAAAIGSISLLILIVWESKFVKRVKQLQRIPVALIVVIVGTLINQYLLSSQPQNALTAKRLVALPVATGMSSFVSLFTLPDFNQIGNPQVWITGLTLAIVASLETLLGIEAVDKLDPLKRVTPANRELKAQGIGNIVSGMLGGLPLTSVVVRSSANVSANAKTKLSAIMHGILLLLSVMFMPGLLNKIPLSALAAVLIFTGYKLVKIPLFTAFYKRGWDQFIPFIVTFLAIYFTDLLVGIVVGIIVGLFFMVRSNFRSSVFVVNDNQNFLIRLRKDVSFLNKPIVKQKLELVPRNANVLIDATRADFIDKDVIEEVNNFLLHAHLKNIHVEIKKSSHKPMHLLFHEPKTV